MLLLSHEYSLLNAFFKSTFPVYRQATEPNDIMNPTTRAHWRDQTGRAFEKELIRQARAEHALRMEILQMKHRYWQIKTDSLLRRSQNFTEDNGVYLEAQNKTDVSV